MFNTIFSPVEPIIPNENMIIINLLKSNDNDCLRGLEMISDDLLYDTRKYNFPKCSPHIVKLIQTRLNTDIIESATRCLRTAVESNPDNVEMLMTSSTVDAICHIFNQEFTKTTTEHTIHILHAISKYSSIALTNSLDYNQFFRFICNENNPNIEKRLLSSILLNITQISVSDFLLSQTSQLMQLCTHQDSQISFNSLSSLINVARISDANSIPNELTCFLCDKLMDPKLHKVHDEITELLIHFAKNKDHALAIHQQDLDFERLLFSSEFINSRTNFNHILNLILTLLPYVNDLSIFNLSSHQRPSINDFDIYKFSRKIKKLMKRVITEKPLDVKTTLIVYAVTLECEKNEKIQKTKEHQSNDVSNYIFDIGSEDNLFQLNDTNFENESDFEPPYFDENNDQELHLIGLSDDDKNHKKEEKESESDEIENQEENQEENNNDNEEKESENDESENEIDEDLLMALISFSIIASNAPYILAVISYYGNSAKLNECYLLQLIRDFPVQSEFQEWFRQTINRLEYNLSKISMPRPLVNLTNLNLQQINQLALENQIPSYQFLFGGGVKICLKLFEEESIIFDESNLDFDISGITKLAFSLVSLLPMPIIMNDPSIKEFINILKNPAPVSIISNLNGKFKSTVPLIEPVWTLKGLVDITVSQKNPKYLHRLMANNKKLEKFIRIESVQNPALRPANIAILIKAFEDYAQSNKAIYSPNLPINNAANLGIPSSFNRDTIFHSSSTGSFSFFNNSSSNSSSSTKGDATSSSFKFPFRRREGLSSSIAVSSGADQNEFNFSGTTSSDEQNRGGVSVDTYNAMPRIGGQKIVRRRIETNFPIPPSSSPPKTATTTTTASPNNNQPGFQSKKFTFNFKFPSTNSKSKLYPDYENTSIFSIFCDKAKSASEILKVQPEINLNDYTTKMKFEPLPNQYFTDLFNLLKILHDNYNVETPVNLTRSFVSTIHEQLSNPFGSIGRKSYAMTVIFKYPFLFPFSERILAYKLVYLDPYFATRRLIREFKSDDRITLKEQRPEPLKFIVRRNFLFEDGKVLLENFFGNKIEVDVQFLGEKGTGMGPTREFLSNLSREFTRKKNKMFRNDSSFLNSSENDYIFSQNGLFPSPEANPDLFLLLGVLVAKAISMECSLDIDFMPAFFEIARGKKIPVSKVDPIFASSLGCPEGFYLPGVECDFTYPGCPNLELKPNGKNILVNKDNVDNYIELVEYATVDGNVKKCIEYFVNGFNRVLPFSSLDIFSEEEIGLIICGGKQLITSSDMAKYCQLDGFKDDSPEISMLYQTVDEMDSNEQKGFIKFVTGSANLPFGGLKVLEPPMTVLKRPTTSANGETDGELPTSNTCNCTLKLPAYSSKDILSKQLKIAISYGNVEFGRS